MALESCLRKRARNRVSFVGEQLRLHSMNSRRLLQRLDNMCQQLHFNIARVGKPVAVADVEVANHSLVALVDKERIAEDAAAIDGRIPWQNLRIHIAEYHLC